MTVASASQHDDDANGATHSATRNRGIGIDRWCSSERQASCHIELENKRPTQRADSATLDANATILTSPSLPSAVATPHCLVSGYGLGVLRLGNEGRKAVAADGRHIRRIRLGHSRSHQAYRIGHSRSRSSDSSYLPYGDFSSL